MPTLLETIVDYEADLLMIIAEKWGFDLDINEKGDIAEQVANLILNQSDALEFINLLPQKAQTALKILTDHNGRLFWDSFISQFGDLREMGTAIREKEKPHHDPKSITEHLFYSGLIGRGFFQSAHGLREYAFVPDEILFLIDSHQPPPSSNNIPYVNQKDIVIMNDCKDKILDHACTYLSLIRIGKPLDKLIFLNPDISIAFLNKLLQDCELINKKNGVNSDRIKFFLQAPRADSFSLLVQDWRKSSTINEIGFLVDITCEGGWKNNSVETRSFLLEWIKSLSSTHWYGIDNLVAWVQENHPFFMRTHGEFESWLVKDTKTGAYIRGTEYWGHIEGSYLLYMLTGPLVWMGILIQGQSSDRKVYISKTEWADDLIGGNRVNFRVQQKTQFKLDKRAKIAVDRLFPLHIRYQVSRFCEFINEKNGQYFYQITASSLRLAQSQGLKIQQLISLINKYGSRPIPDNIFQGLKNWQIKELTACFEQTVQLCVNSEQIIQKLLKSKYKNLIHNQLNHTCVQISREGIPYIKSWLMEEGIFAEWISEGKI